MTGAASARGVAPSCNTVLPRVARTRGECWSVAASGGGRKRIARATLM